MEIIIFGGGGFLGRKLGMTLLQQEQLVVDGAEPQPITKIILFDKKIQGDFPDDQRLELMEGDICDEDKIRTLLASKPAVIFHLAAIVSGEAEKNFDLGMQVNLHASLQMLEISRHLACQPVFVFASSCAVFGEDPATVIRDRTASFPRSSYGTQKAIVDLLINDYSRKGFINGRALRLPTIVVRPGKPNAATTSFVSSIIREPLNGQRAVCPVAPSTPVWILSPQKVIRNFIHAAGINASQLGVNRLINLPGITVTIADMVNSLETVAGKEATSLIDWEADEFLQSIVLTFPTFFETQRALKLGFVKDDNFEEVISTTLSS